MTNFLIDFLSRNSNKIPKVEVEVELSRIFNTLGKDKENIPAALGEAFSQRVPTTLFKESFYAAYKEYSDYKDKIEVDYQGKPIEQAILTNIKLTNVLNEHAPELFNLYYLTLASAYSDIYNSTNFTENDQVIQSDFDGLLSKNTGKIIFSIAANISTITDKLFPILLENNGFLTITDESGNLIDEDGSLNATLAGSIINYIGQLGNRLQTIDDVRDFLQENQTPERMLELQLFELEREVKWGNLSKETDEIKQKYNTFIKLVTEFSESGSSTVHSDVLLDQLNKLKEEMAAQPKDKIQPINDALERTSNLGIQHAEIIDLREKLAKDTRVEENNNSTTPETQKGSSNSSWFKQKMSLASTLVGAGLFSQTNSKNRGNKAASQESSPQSQSPRA